MATTLTPNLKLRVSSDLTSDAVYNLNRIDTLAATFIVTETGVTNVRSQSDINLLPNSPDVGGSGTGGTLNVSASDQSLTDFNIYSDTSIFYGNLQTDELRLPDDVSSPTYYSALRASGSLTSSTTWTLPLADGLVGQVLETDGAGQLRWVTAPTSNLPEFNVRIGDNTDTSQDTDTNALGDILASTTGGFTYKNGSITDLAISATANILRSKLQNGAINQVVINDGSGVLSSEAQLDITRGGTGAANASDARSNLGLIIGTDVQAWDSDLDDIAALTHTDNNVIISSSGAWVTATPATLYGILGLGTIATQDANAVALTGGTIDGTAIGGTTTAAGSFTNIVTTTGSIDVDSAKALTIGSTVGNNDIYIGAATSKVYILGDFEVQGTETTVNTAILDVEDANITINKNGNQAGADDLAGITVEMSDDTNARIIYDKDVPTRFRIGDEGSETEIVDVSSTQTLSNKTFVGTRNTVDTWLTGDGTTKVVTHNFGTTDVIVQVYDTDTGSTLIPDTVSRNDTNTVTLTSSVAPAGTGWRVMIQEVSA
jgi:hypothetical protein